MSTTPPPTTTAAGRDLSAAEAKLRETVDVAARRKTVTLVAMIAFCLILAGYLGFAYYQVKITDAEAVVALAESQADPYLNQSAASWAQQLESQAPTVIDQAAQAALAMPASFTDRVVSYAEERVDQEMPKLKETFSKSLDEMLGEIDSVIRAEYPDGKIPDAEAEQVLTQVAEQFGTSLQAEFDRIYDRYAQVSAEMISTLDELTAENPTKTQQLHRQLLESFLAVIQRVQAQDPA